MTTDDLLKKIKMLEGLAKIPLSNPNPCVVMDISGVLLFRNKAYNLLFEELKENGHILREKLFEYCGLALREQRSLTTEVSFADKYFLMSAFPDPKETSTTFFLIDVSRQKQLEMDLRESSRLSMLGEMTGSIAHEIGNPLFIINANANILLKMAQNEQLNNVELQRRSHKIKEMITRVEVIIKTLKGFSRGNAETQRQFIDPIEIFKATKELMAIRLKKTEIELTFESEPDIRFFADLVPLSQIFINLINNAVDAVYDTEKPWIKVRCYKQNDQIIVDVQDSGNGIPEAIRSQLFKRVITSKPEGKGTGLGLRITKQLIESFDGKIEIDDQSKHTRFLIYFPNFEVKSSCLAG